MSMVKEQKTAFEIDVQDYRKIEEILKTKLKDSTSDKIVSVFDFLRIDRYTDEKVEQITNYEI